MPLIDDVLRRHAVTVRGMPDGPTAVLLHGFGADQSVWAAVAADLEATHRLVLLDHAGCGASDPRAHDPVRHATLDGYAEDVVAVAEALDLRDATVVGHSVGGAVALLATAAAPHRFASAVTIGSSARYLDDEGYTGGFSQADVDEVLLAIDDNYLAWAQLMAPAFVGNPDRPELSVEFAGILGRLDPGVAKAFARTTFTCDIRDRLADVAAPVLVLQCADDVVVPDAAAAHMAAALPRGELQRLDATGHCPLLSAPEQVASAIRRTSVVRVR